MKIPVITISIPVMFCTESLSPNIINEKHAVRIGIKLVNTFALVIPMFFIEKAKRINAPHEAKTDSAIIGKKCSAENGVIIR